MNSSEPVTARSYGDSDLGLARTEMRKFRETSIGWPVALLLLIVFVHVGALGVALSGLFWPWRLLAALIVAATGARLFLIGHDAAHGSYTPSTRLNRILGRVALVPTLHSHSLWHAGHMKHHRFTNLRARDFVWTPLSKADYDRLTAVGRALHRVYRSGLGLGLGLYYLIEIWAPRMLVPRRSQIGAVRAEHRWDTGLLALYILGLAGVALWLAVAWGVAGTPWHWLSVALFGLVLPLAIQHWLIGFVIYFNHTHPEIPWFDDAEAWSYWHAQVECTTHPQMEFPRPYFIPNQVMNHTAHHMDMRIPLRQLDRAQARLEEVLAGPVQSYAWSWGAFRRILRTCRLYDYDRHRWLDWSGAVLSEEPGRAVASALERAEG